MSASIRWRVLSTEPGSIYVGWSSAFVSAMTRAFGNHPWRLTGEHLPMLRGMAATDEDVSDKNPYMQIMDKIETEDGTVNVIEVWPEY